MFKRIGHRIALQFTAFVFLLFLINGLLFLLADLGNARRQTQHRLERMSRVLVDRSGRSLVTTPRRLPPMLRDRVRIIDEKGNTIFGGDFFQGVPVPAKPGFSQATIDGEQVAIVTLPIEEEDGTRGFAQIAEIERQQRAELPSRALLYLIVSVAISSLTFLVGLFFARRSLKPAEHMVERLEQFTQDASHELRTPLATINSSLDLALKTRNYREGIVSAKEDLKEISVLVERLLELARLDKFVLQKHAVDLSMLVEDSVERHRVAALERKITIEKKIKDDVTVRGDAALLRQVVSNLLSNAIKFSKPQGGKIHVMLTQSELKIEDTGIGIGEQDLARIFDRFYQAEASRADEGFGLGLALVKRIVELHGWNVTVQSKVDQGTLFIVKLSS